MFGLLFLVVFVEETTFYALNTLYKWDFRKCWSYYTWNPNHGENFVYSTTTKGFSIYSMHIAQPSKELATQRYYGIQRMDLERNV